MENKFKVVVSVAGRFHLFNLAEQLLKRGLLDRLITSYPKFSGPRYGVPSKFIKSILIKEILERGWRKISKIIGSTKKFDYRILNIYDRLSSLFVGSPDIFIGLASSSLYAIRKAKAAGAVAVADYGSSHPLYQQNILKEEERLFGVKMDVSDERIIRKSMRAFAEADYISIPSNFVKRTFIQNGIPEEKLIHIPYGVDLSAFKQVPKKDDVFRVVFAGGMSLRKGVHYLLQAFAELDLPNSELMLLGAMNNEIAPFFEKYKGHFNYVGKIPQAELYKYYSQGSVFCMLSIEEGLALVQPQAMACGLPIICTTNTGGDDIVRDGQDGFVIPIRDVGALKEKLLYLYNNPGICSQMGQSAKQRVSVGFTWNDYGEKMVAEYAKILRNKNA